MLEPGGNLRHPPRRLKNGNYRVHTSDLGLIESERILVFGGPYGNLEALQALFAEAEKLGVVAEHTICTGDIVAYCADPLATANFIRDKNIRVIAGNCEQSLAADSGNCGCGFEDGSDCDVLSQAWFSYCESQIKAEIKEWFSDLPDHLRFRFGGQDFAVVHGSPTHISEFVFASDPEEQFENHIRKANVNCMIGGHSGLPFTKVMGNQCWHNPGVIGMPANDATPRVWYSLITRTDAGILFEHKSLSYPVAVAKAKMNDVGLPRGYAQALSSGIWPSIDILPECESLQAGVELNEHKVEWKTS